MRQAARRLIKSSLNAAGTVAVGTVAVGLVCQEVVPFGADGRRCRPLATSWVAPLIRRDEISGCDVARLRKLKDYVKEQWPEGRITPIPPAGRVVVEWSPQAVAAVHSRQRHAVEHAAKQAVAALEEIARETGFGSHILGSGWHVEMIPSTDFICASTDHLILLSTGAVQACWSHCRHDPQAALFSMLSHEIGHRMALHAADRLMSLSRQAAARVCCVASVAGATTVRALCQGRAPSWDRMSAAVAEADTAVRLRLADELKRLRWQHEYEADAIACAALARRGMPMEHMADSLRLSGWRPKLQLRVGPLQLELLSGGEGPSKGELTRQASKALSSAAKRDGEGEGSQLGADPELDLLANFPMTERLWLRGAPPAEQVTILVRLMQSHPPVGQRVERIRRLAAQHIDREAERAQR